MKEKRQNPERVFINRYEPSSDIGLNGEQVKERRENGLINKTAADNAYSLPNIIIKNVFTYFNFIFFVFAAVLLWHKSYNNLAFLGVIFSNSFMGIFQEVKSARELNKLNIMTAAKSTVIRDGKEISIDSDDLVLDDIIVLKSGNQIPADAVIRDGSVYVNEALVTGEPDEIQRTGGERLMSGSFIVSGTCRAKLDAVGEEAFAAKISHDAKKMKKRKRPGMMRSLNTLIRIIGIIIIPFSVLMFMSQRSNPLLSQKDAVENTVAALIGMIPEGLYLLTTIALLASTVRLAKKKTLVHDMKCIEALARVDIICVDKTGTITEPEMAMNEVIPLKNNADIGQKIKDLVFNMQTENITLAAIKKYYGGTAKRAAAETKEFSSVHKFSAAAFSDGSVYILGAPEIILKDEYKKYDSILKSHLDSGERVLVFGETKRAKNDKIFTDSAVVDDIEPLAFITLSNPIRENAKDTFEFFAAQGVEVKVISGDNPQTVSAAAEAAGIQNADKYIDASKLGDDEISSKKMLDYTVFGRVSPAQKRTLIRTFKAAKHTVAMTGDGVNDVLALKEADCSIAMASGSEAASNVADLVLVNSDFAGMPKIVDEGRRVINNIERTAALFLVKNIFSFIMTLIAIVTVSTYPLKPVQISLVSSMMVGIPSFFLALAPNKNLVRGNFLANVLKSAMPAALTAVISAECALIIAETFNIDYGSLTTMTCIIYAFSAYMMLFKVCKPLKSWRGVLFAAMGIGFAACIAAIPWFFNIVRLNAACVIITVLIIIPVYPLQRAIEMIIAKMSHKQ